MECLVPTSRGTPNDSVRLPSSRQPRYTCRRFASPLRRMRMPVKPRILMHLEYEEEAQAYLRSLPPEHFMEATAQATQRKITLESLDLVVARRSDVHVFNDLLVQYALRGQRNLGQVVPDNMVVITGEPMGPKSSFNVPLEPAPPFWVLEYVSE